jgi:predicted O-linked N-acetylglucosamine transferase (SPINDLY family)
MTSEIKKNSISSLLEPIHQIPHNISCMNHEERKQHLIKIKEYVEKIKATVEKTPDFEKERTDLAVLSAGLPVFSLAYYGLSIKDILQDVVEIYKNSFSHHIEKINNKYKCGDSYNKPYKKILFFSARMNCVCSVYRSTYKLLSHLSKASDIHVDLMTKFPINNEAMGAFSNCKNIIQSENIQKDIERIGSGRYDAIVYPDMNMDPTTSCIGLFRLAPTQITTFGHSESSGMADYFITSKYYETEPEKNYTEKPVCFDSLALCYDKINLETHIKNFKPREYFQIHKDSNIYYCNSSFFKMGKEMFDIFKGILDKDKDAVIVLTKLNFANFDLLFFTALEQNLGINYANRIKFLSRLNYEENINLLYLSDVFIESYPFGNMNSTLECFATGLPVVSMPTNKINGRFTYGYYKKIGLESEYCVNSIEEYIDKAVSIATLKNKSKRTEIFEKSKVLFDEEKSCQDWENFIRNL